MMRRTAGWKRQRPAAPSAGLIDRAEVAKAVAYLASSESGLMTGANVDFDQTILGAHD
jgi:NAD(P)-dependent dehydrogenase (short-subunit alcohol dehydrogenase family)